MSELGNLIRNLRGKRTQAAVAKGSGLNTRTLVRAENGDEVALTTIRTLRSYFKLNDSDYAELLKAWISLQLGDDRKHVNVTSPYSAKGAQRRAPEKQFLDEFRNLPGKYQKQLSLALKRREVLNALLPINDMYEKLNRRP